MRWGQLLNLRKKHSAFIVYDYKATRQQYPPRPQVVRSGKCEEETVTNNKRLKNHNNYFVESLRSVWREAGLHQFAPECSGTRNWEIVARSLTAVTNSYPRDLWFVVNFSKEEKNKIARKLRRSANRDLQDLPNNWNPFIPVIAEYESLCQKISQMSDFPLQMNDGFQDEINEAFAKELCFVRDDPENMHLMIYALFATYRGALPIIGAMDCMMVNENWLPFENAFDKQVIDELTAANRHFEVNLSFDCPRPSIILTDTSKADTALYITPEGVEEEYSAQREKQVDESNYFDWLWDPASGKEHIPFPPSKW
jgi:hypothetical protein